MKKILIGAICLSAFGVLTAHANTKPIYPTGCDYTENMHIKGPAGSKILKLSSSTLAVFRISDDFFQIVGSCANGSEGTVQVTIGVDSKNFVALTIQDGQSMWNPEVIDIQPFGNFQYTGIDHPYGTFDYTLKFSR